MGKKLYVGNLPFSATDDSLKQLFARFGAVVSAKIVTDRDTGRSRGFGFVEMEGDREATEAVSGLNGKEFEGRTLTVSEARAQEQQRPRGGFRGGREGGGYGPRGRG